MADEREQPDLGNMVPYDQVPESQPPAQHTTAGARLRLGRLERAALFGLAVVALGFAVVLVFVIPEDRPNSEAVQLLSGLAWPFVALAAIIVFHAQVGHLLANIASRVAAGSGFSIGKFLTLTEATEATKHVPAPAPGMPVTLANIALLHSTWFSQKHTLQYNDGQRYYRVDVAIVARFATLQRIESVTYRLPDSWSPELRERTLTNVENRFLMKELLNGTAIVTAEVRFKNQEQPLHLNRFLDIRNDGQHLG
jgi:hypothetical protein